MATRKAAPMIQPPSSALQSYVVLGEALVGSFAPLLGPNGMLAYAAIKTATDAIMGAMNGGQDVTDAQIDELFNADALAVTADDLAQAAKAK